QQARCRIEQGYARMSELSCAWLLLARDVARQLPLTLARLEHTAGYFAAAEAFVYENDSVDRTGKCWKPGSRPACRSTWSAKRWPGPSGRWSDRAIGGPTWPTTATPAGSYCWPRADPTTWCWWSTPTWPAGATTGWPTRSAATAPIRPTAGTWW